MQPIVQSILVAILPLIGLILPGILKQDKFSSQTNTAISIIVVLFASGATAYAYDQFGSNLLRDAILVFTGMEVLLQGKLKPLDAYLQSNIFTSLQHQLPAIEQAVTALSVPTAHSYSSSNALIHITANTVHIPTSPTAKELPVVLPVSDPVEPVQEAMSVAGDIVPGDAPIVTGVTTQEEASQKTQKIAVVKATTQLAG